SCGASTLRCPVSSRARRRVLTHSPAQGRGATTGQPKLSRMDEPIPSPRTRIGLLRPLRHRDFRLLWVGQTISMVGDGTYYVATAWLVYHDLHGTPADFAAVGIAWSLPQVLLVLASGALSDRIDRRRLMIAGALLG